MGNEVANNIIILYHTFSVRFEDIEEASLVDTWFVFWREKVEPKQRGPIKRT